MKQFIKRWLGITESKLTVDECNKIVSEVVDNNELTDRIVRRLECNRTYGDRLAVSREAENFVRSEEFLDKIIERIKKKQL